MYNEADDRMVEQGITIEDVNKELSQQNSNQNSINFQTSNFIHPPSQSSFYSEATPIIQAKPYQNIVQVERIDSEKNNFKRQKVSEEADFTSSNLMVPISKSLSKISTIAVNEDKCKTPAQNDQSISKHNSLKANFQSASKSNEIQIVDESEKVVSPVSVFASKPALISNNARVNSLPEVAASSNDPSFKEKEQVIRLLEKREESKIIDKDTDELSLKIQKSIYKNCTPLNSPDTSKYIKCICGDSYACDETKLIMCSNCRKKQHRQCIDNQKSMSPYICVFCQLYLMDLINLPIAVLVEPMKIVNTETKIVKFELDQKYENLIKKKGPYKIEIRGIRLNEVPFKNSWPNFGEMSLNGSDWSVTLTLPEREQSRKRKDDPITLTQYFMLGKKSHILSIRKKNNPTSQKLNDEKYNYCIGVFLVYTLEIPQIIQYHKTYELESFINTYQMVRDRLFPNHKEDDIHVISDELKVPMKCPVTLSDIKIPARGFQCAHVECFDLINFMKTNKSFRSFKCPHCNKSSNLLKIDSFLLILKQIYSEKLAKEELESFTITKNLEINCNGLSSPISMNLLIDSYISILKRDINCLFTGELESKQDKLSDSEDEIAKEPTSESNKTSKPVDDDQLKIIELD